jgi:MYXO-CTERM domain-containing protein
MSLAFTLGLGLPSLAHADIISDEEGACRGKDAGAACQVDGKAGSCVASTCYRNDYSNGPPPKSKQVECLECKPGEAAPAPTEPDTKSTVQPDAKPADAKPADAKPADAKPADAKPADAKPADAKDAKSTSPAKSCAVATGEPTSWSLAMIGVVALALARRKSTR